MTSVDLVEASIPGELHDALLRDLPDVLFVSDAEGRLTWLSPNAHDLFGFEVEEMVGHFAADFYVRPEERGDVVERLRRAQGSTLRIDVEMRRQDGASFWAAMFAGACFGLDGRFIGMAGSIRDVTDIYDVRRTLQDSEARLQHLSDVANEAICIHRDGQLLDFNKAFEDLFGYGRAELMVMRALDVIDPRDASVVWNNIDRRTEKPYEVRGVRKDGTIIPIEIRSKNSRCGGLPVRVTCIRDLREQKLVEERIRLLSHAVDQSPVAVMLADGDGIVRYVNDAYGSMTGCRPSEVVSRSLWELYADSVGSGLWSSLGMRGEWSGEVEVAGPDGRCRWHRIGARRVDMPGSEVVHYIVQAEDVTLRREQERRLRHQAMFDGLTNLPNRTRAVEHLTREIETARTLGRRVALLFVDLDDFKAINDSLGHEYGDELLVLASERLRRAAGEGRMAARFGGDEFLVIIGGLEGEADGREVAEAVVEKFGRPFAIGRRELITTASVGVALYPDDGRTAQILLRNADAAMYQAKQAGRNRHCFFTSHMNEEAEARLRMENELRVALGKNQFRLVFQPLVGVACGRTIGVEALLRWDSPVLGAVPPDQFIPRAETCGAIVPIGRWVLETACRTAREWVDAGHHDFRICVNVSPRQVQEAGFLDDVRRILDRTRLPPGNLELEITEGLLLSERGGVDQLLAGLVGMGVRLSIDDFGTGYSSLSYLERFPFDTLKIDRSFMAGMLERQERRVLVDTIVAMASGLGLKVIAEGVETCEQLAHLAEIKCDIAQGYLFGRPLPGEQVPEILRTAFI